MNVRGRFAPSPTGRLHLGNARSALLGWLQARTVGGAFLLRIEDLDPARSRASYVDDLLRDLKYLGVDWDETPLYQSQRGEAYDAALEVLKARGELYPCFCSRAEIARAASAPHGPSDEGPRYPGTCAHRSAAEQEALTKQRTPSWRFRAPPSEVIDFEDGLAGAVSQNVDEAVGDFIVRRADGVASYQLAVVVDDAHSGITDVLRGDDLLSSTPRQIALYRALGLSVPRFTHVPLVMGADGKRLAKREGAFALTELREAGVPRERVLGLLAKWMGQRLPESLTPAELVAGFEWKKIPREPLVAEEADIRAALHFG